VDRVLTCQCGRAFPATTYNRKYCSVQCRRRAERQQGATHPEDWADFWATLGEVPTYEAIPTPTVPAAKRR
jgi:hypothetical protein